MSRPSVLLFDIDDTLINTCGAGLRALERALERCCGAGPWLEFHVGGMTDRGIVRETLGQRGRPADEATIDAVLEAYLEELAIEVATAPGYVVNPGVEALLERAALDPSRWALGLGTGNIARGAEIKLARVGLWARFAFGGFGSDHEDRPELLRAGAWRGAERLGHSLERCRVVIIGDTPRDVAAALAIGASCVGVATGRYGALELLASGADAAFADLACAGAALAVLG